jgi:hypothetical protein
LLLAVLAAATWIYHLKSKWAGAAATANLHRAAAVERVQDLENVLHVREGELKEALARLSRSSVKPRLVVASRKEFQSAELVEEAPRPSETPALCEDWVDEHGRFRFNQSLRRLEVNQRFRVRFLLTQLANGRVKAAGELEELSPATGEPLRTVPVESDALAYWTPPLEQPAKWRAFVGTELGLSGWRPLLRVERRLPLGFRIGAEVSDQAHLYAGWAFEFAR